MEYTPHRGSGDKLARLNSVADIVKSGLVWVPETRWAEEVVEEIAGFPFMSHDDLVDSTVMALPLSTEPLAVSWMLTVVMVALALGSLLGLGLMILNAIRIGFSVGPTTLMR